MVAFTVENMIEACKIACSNSDRKRLLESFRMLRLYDLIDGKTFSKFYESYSKEFYGKKG